MKQAVIACGNACSCKSRTTIEIARLTYIRDQMMVGVVIGSAFELLRQCTGVKRPYHKPCKMIRANVRAAVGEIIQENLKFVSGSQHAVVRHQGDLC
jgi:hypothetical protein